jgi:hypothetical protein
MLFIHVVYLIQKESWKTLFEKAICSYVSKVSQLL